MRVELSLVSPRHQVDDEVVRDHALTLLRVWVLRCQDHVRSLDQEVELLEGMEKHRGGANDWKATPPDPGDRKPMKPVVITKQMLQVLIARSKIDIICYSWDGDIILRPHSPSDSHLIH